MIGSTANIVINQSIEARFSLRDSRTHPGQEPPLGSHLVTPRTFYSHHGIDVGGARVVHYADFAHGWRRGPVEEVSLERFADSYAFRLLVDRPCFDRREAVQRTRSRLGDCRYDILRNIASTSARGRCATRRAVDRWSGPVPFLDSSTDGSIVFFLQLFGLRQSNRIEYPARDAPWHALNSTECNPAAPAGLKRDRQRSVLARDCAVGAQTPAAAHKWGAALGDHPYTKVSTQTPLHWRILFVIGLVRTEMERPSARAPAPRPLPYSAVPGSSIDWSSLGCV
jgi:Lecithin retinol acyltransferase